MTQVLEQELANVLTRPPRPVPPTVEHAIQAAASTLTHAPVQMITSTTVVVDIGADDLNALRRLVAGIANARGLDAAVKPRVGWCSVRFSRR